MKFGRWWIAAAAIGVFATSTAYAKTAIRFAKSAHAVRIGTVDLNSISSQPSSGALVSQTFRSALSSQGVAARARAVNRRIVSGPVSARSLSAAAPSIGDERTSPLSIRAVRGALSLPIVTSDPSYMGFVGLTEADSDTANAGNPLGIGVEPPDQGLCVGDNEVVEAVNLAFAIYGTSGDLKYGPISLNSVFGAPATDFLTDPRCYYDARSRTFFITASDLGGSVPPRFASQSWILLGVMPAGGSTVTTYSIDTTDNGRGNCPCFADQPLLGADQYGIYIVGNMFPMSTSNAFNGAALYAVNKSDLINQIPSPVYVDWDPMPKLGRQSAASVQPALSSGADFETANGGTEYFLSSMIANSRDRRLGIWAVINTCGIPSGAGPSTCSSVPLLLGRAMLTKAYSVPPPATQMIGPYPYGESQGYGLETIDTGDDRMQQTMFAHGMLFAGLTTGLKLRKQQVQSAILYFILKPTVVRHRIGVKIISSHYLYLDGADIYYPSIAANPSGSAVLAFSMSGQSYFPGTAYVPLMPDPGQLQLHIAQSGQGPYDGASGSPLWPARWGDYSAAAVDESGNLWMAAEYIASQCSVATYSGDYTCGGTRGEYANWATGIGEITIP